MTRSEYLKIASEFVRPCHSIHCRHHDLADGMICEVEWANLQEAQTVADENAQMKADEGKWEDNGCQPLNAYTGLE